MSDKLLEEAKDIIKDFVVCLTEGADQHIPRSVWLEFITKQANEWMKKLDERTRSF